MCRNIKFQIIRHGSHAALLQKLKLNVSGNYEALKKNTMKPDKILSFILTVHVYSLNILNIQLVKK